VHPRHTAWHAPRLGLREVRSAIFPRCPPAPLSPSSRCLLPAAAPHPLHRTPCPPPLRYPPCWPTLPPPPVRTLRPSSQLDVVFKNSLTPLAVAAATCCCIAVLTLLLLPPRCGAGAERTLPHRTFLHLSRSATFSRPCRPAERRNRHILPVLHRLQCDDGGHLPDARTRAHTHSCRQPSLQPTSTHARTHTTTHCPSDARWRAPRHPRAPPACRWPPLSSRRSTQCHPQFRTGRRQWSPPCCRKVRNATSRQLRVFVTATLLGSRRCVTHLTAARPARQ
jgi:hypothetical protein